MGKSFAGRWHCFQWLYQHRRWAAHGSPVLAIRANDPDGGCQRRRARRCHCAQLRCFQGRRWDCCSRMERCVVARAVAMGQLLFGSGQRLLSTEPRMFVQRQCRLSPCSCEREFTSVRGSAPVACTKSCSGNQCDACMPARNCDHNCLPPPWIMPPPTGTPSIQPASTHCLCVSPDQDDWKYLCFSLSQSSFRRIRSSMTCW